ncbi:hypothetical protein LTR78_003287 [Recurvomyces mirabilis]|uniref:Uncharacterized protein n=1 Tax=Recurvomyces mirabilis TaxID=574656 RepID=A0AAE0WS80_9PEZI|nr:hypothetical protein LTR78_003287 [Recurvomyces mirabilis]KAK5156895.1 hypothetical protein LTS14_004412 [Recurvomyces mirabilis]
MESDIGAFALSLDEVGLAFATRNSTAQSKAQVSTRVSTWPGPFRLFDLPSELRLRIYEMALAPKGVLHLTSTNIGRKAVVPAITPALLATNHRIYHEAQSILLDQNEVMLTVNAHDTCWPTISETRLPQPVLERLRHFCVILDCTDYFNASYADVDFDAFSALTSLKTFRLTSIYRRNQPSQVLAPLHIPRLKDFNVVAQILERIPASTILYFATEQDSQQNQVVQALIETRSAGDGKAAEEAPAVDLEAAAMGVPGLVRGCKSARGVDVFAWSRAVKEGHGSQGLGRERFVV